MVKKLLFSITSSDCDWDYFRGSGPGGQNRNKVSTAVRCTHRESGAVGTAMDSRSQLDNRRAAFRRMADTAKFQAWHKIETARRMGKLAAIDDEVDQQMRPVNLRIDVQQNGRWIEEA